MQRTDKPHRITPAGRALHNPVGWVDDRAPDAHSFLDRLRPDDCLCVLGEGYMTKRDRQASEYATESYEKGDEIRTNSTTIRDTTPAVGSVQRDLIERLRRWAVATDAVPALDLMDEAADEIARLREAIRRLADQDATLSVQGGCVIVEMECQVLSQKNLTDEERDAVEWFAEVRKPLTRLTQNHNREKYKDTLRKLLERNDHDAVPDAIANADGEPAPKCGGEAGLSSRDGTGNTHTLTDDERNALEFAVETGRVAMHDEATLRKLLDREGDELSALAPADRQNITQESQNSDTLPAYGVWRDRSEQPPMDKPVLLFTNHLDGFMWIGRRGLLPNDVSHWTPLPEPPNVK